MGRRKDDQLFPFVEISGISWVLTLLQLWKNRLGNSWGSVPSPWVERESVLPWLGPPLEGKSFAAINTFLPGLGKATRGLPESPESPQSRSLSEASGHAGTWLSP